MEKIEVWVITNDAQYRIRNRRNTEHIQLTFWLSDGKVEHFNTTYQNLLIMLKSADEDLYSSKPL